MRKDHLHYLLAFGGTGEKSYGSLILIFLVGGLFSFSFLQVVLSPRVSDISPGSVWLFALSSDGLLGNWMGSIKMKSRVL